MAAGLNATQLAEVQRMLETQAAQTAQVMRGEIAETGQAVRGEVATVAADVAELAKRTAGVVAQMQTESSSFATELSKATGILDAKASELNDKQTALDGLMTNMEASIVKFNNDGRTLGERVDAQEKRLTSSATAQM